MRGMRRVLLRLLIWPMILLRTCSPLPAEQPEPTLPAPSIGLPTVERLVSLLGSSELYSGSEIADWLVNDLFPLEVEPAVRVAFRQVAEQAGAEAVKPVLVELAGVTAERDAYRRVVLRWQIVAGVSCGVTIGFAVLAIWLAAR